MFNPVRHKVKDLVELVQDDDRLKQERKRSKKNRDKYKGVSSMDFSRSYSKICLSNIKETTYWTGPKGNR